MLAPTPRLSRRANRSRGAHRAPLAKKTRSESRRRLAWTVAVLLALGAFGSIGSWAAWQMSDTNAANSFSTGTVLLEDNQGGQAGAATSSGTAMFSVTGMSPGSAATTRCIEVQFSGATASSMTLTAALGGADSVLLGGQLTMDVAQFNTGGSSFSGGSNTNSGSCVGYPAGGSNTTIGTQGSTLTSWAGSSYPIGSPVTNTWYKFTISGLPGGATSCSTYCSKVITLALTWTLTAS